MSSSSKITACIERGPSTSGLIPGLLANAVLIAILGLVCYRLHGPELDLFFSKYLNVRSSEIILADLKVDHLEHVDSDSF